MKRNQAVSITDAAPSHGEQLHRRQVRYVLMMGFRGFCLILITVLVTEHARFLVLWVPVLLFGILIVPWLAVILANDGSPRERYRLANKFRPGVPTQRSLAVAPSTDDQARTIDADP